MIIDVKNLKVGDWVVADRCFWTDSLYVLPGAHLRVTNIPLSNNGRVSLFLNINEFIQISVELDVSTLSRDFSKSGDEPEGIPRPPSRYDLAKDKKDEPRTDQ